MTAAASRPTGRLRRTAGGLYAGVGTLMVVLLAVFTITATQTPPPAIAEIAPQAAEQIKEAPDSQSSPFGSGDGGLGGVGGVATTTTTTTAEAVADVTETTAARIERARVRRCVGNPPRQTEDPQSPPCVPFWEGDNGGATTQGVTRDEIVVVAPCQANCPADRQRVHRLYQDYFNKRFEFYGRKLRIVFGTNGGPQCAGQKAAATQYDEELKAFAVLDSNTTEGACLHQESARRGVISSNTYDLLTESEMQAAQPYLWQYSMAPERLFSGVGEMICARLHPGNAVHSPDPLFKERPRKFGVILQVAERDGDIPLAPLEQTMAKCGAKLDAKIVEEVPGYSEEGPQVSARTILALKTEEITSVICLCLSFREQYLPVAATNQRYFPEWVMSSYGLNDSGLWLKVFWTSEQRTSIMGVASRPPALRPDQNPVCQAAAEGDPKASCRTAAEKEGLPAGPNVYWSLLLVASGIQMAGPHLTPAAFAAGLHRTDFPYPTDDPIHAGDVGFQDGDHSMTDDFAEYWWSEGAAAPDGQDRGAVCYVDNATRRRRGAWPRGEDPFFRGPCDSGGGP